jgi:transglutaminase-like putative cysteine protease
MLSVLLNKHQPLHKLPTLFLLVLCFLLTSLSAQEPVTVKFGKVSPEDRALMTVPGVDSSAEAYVLHKALEVELIQDNRGAPILKEYHHRRVKLLTEAGFDEADVTVVYNREYESVYSLKAGIHFPDGGSRKLERKEFIRERYDDNRDIVKFTFPGVREGAVIEYSYVKNDKAIIVPSRYFFQENVPVRYAEYRSTIPFMFNYVSLANGSNQYDISRTNVVNESYGGENIRQTELLWAFIDLEAYTEQPYVNNFSDYVPQVRMQLQSVNYPGQAIQEIFSNWKKTTKELDDWAGFGRAFHNKGNSNKVWKVVEPLLAGFTTEEEKAKVLYEFVAGRIGWDGKYSWTSENTPNKVYEAASGSSGEASILLLALLRQAGIASQPLLIPLRDGGAPMEIYPLLSQFDHVMVVATLEGKQVILDPGSIHRPMGLPRVAALNHRAFVADPDNPRWIDIGVPKASRTIMATMVIDEHGMADVDLNSRLSSYYGFSGRWQLEEMEDDNELPLVVDIIESFPEAEVVSHEIAENDEVSGPLTMKLNMKVPVGEAIDDYLYIQPVLCPVLDKGLADVEERLYPVDFAYPWQERYISTITLPEGFVVDELPESQRVSSEDGTIVCTFAIEDKGNNTVSLNFTVSVKKTVYAANEYLALRKMFKMIIDFQETTLVLKRAK